EVADTGRGVAPEHLPRLFDRFYRVDPARSSASGSVGLGLAIVKGIAELHGGSVTLTSEIGRGTRVTLLLPAAADTEGRNGEGCPTDLPLPGYKPVVAGSCRRGPRNRGSGAGARRGADFGVPRSFHRP